MALSLAVTLVVVGYLLTGLLGLGGGIYLFHAYRHRPLGQSIGALLFLIAVWAFGYGGEVVSTTLAGKIWWLTLAYPGAALAPVAWLVVGMQYAGYGDWLTNRRLALIVLPEVIAVLLVFTNQHHHLMYQAFAISTASGHPTLVHSHELGFWLYLAYSYLLAIAGTAFVVAAGVTSNRLYLWQSIMVVLAALVPTLINLPSIMDVAVFRLADLTPIGFLLSGTILAVTVRISEPLGFLPVARQTVFDSLEDGVLVVDGNGQVIDANASAATMFEGECMGAGIDTILPDQVFDGESLGADLATGVEVELDRGGERRWYLVRSRTIQQGIRTPGRVLTFTDVTERKRRERMLEQKNQQLEGVADVISHDVQTPLATAKRSRRLIEGELDDPDPAVSESLATIERSHDRLSNLSEHLLVLAREGEPVGESHPVDLESVAADAWEIVDADSQTLEIDGTRTLDADRTRLRQLFENLFRNARDHGGNTVRVGTTPDTFFVEDDGPGLPAGAAETIFEYGYTTEHGNTGLGLAIVESIAAGHGWEVRASEAESGGARFEVRTDP